MKFAYFLKKCCLFFLMSMLVPSLQASNALTSAFAELLGVEPSPIVWLQFPYNINTDYVTTTLVSGGTVTQSAGKAVLQTSASGTGSAIMASRTRLAYRTGQGGAAIFVALFTTGVANNTQIIGLGNTQDGFFFGYNGTSFGLLRRNNSVDTWTAQASWNGDQMNGSGPITNPSGVTLDPTKGNVFKIQYQWLGFGAIKFFIQQPANGSWILVHTIGYANVNTSTSVLNPSLQLWVQATNAGNTSNITLQTSSMAAQREGQTNVVLETRNAIFNNKTSNGTLTNLLTIQNNTTFNGIANQVKVDPDFIAIMNTGGGAANALISVYLNPTVAGTPIFTNINAATSVVSYDTAGTTVTGGKLLTTFYCDSASVFLLDDIAKNSYQLDPGDRMVIAVQALNGGPTIYASISWRERF